MTENRKIKWGIMGLGAQGARIAQAIGASGNGQLTAVFSEAPARAEEIAKLYNVASFSDEKQFFDKSGAEAVFICSPNHQHARQAISALKAGKHVLCEKPLAISLADAKKIEAAVKKNNRLFGVGYHLRFQPAFKEAKKIIDSGQLGRLRLVEARWSIGRPGETEFSPLKPFQRWREDPKLSGGGALAARGTHLFDLFLFLLDQKPREVYAWSDAKSDKENDQLTGGLIDFGQTKASLVTSRRLPFAKNELVVYGSLGRLFLPDPFRPDGLGQLEYIDKDGVVHEKDFMEKTDPYQEEVENFSQAILGDKPWQGASLADGMISVALAEAWLASARKKKAIAVKV